MYNSDDTTMQTITIIVVNSHYTICSNNSMYIICTRTKPAIFSNKPHCSTTMVEKGKGKWVKIIYTMSLYVHIRVATCLNETKKGGKTSKSKKFWHLKNGNIGMANVQKKQRRQDRDGLVMMAR